MFVSLNNIISFWQWFETVSTSLFANTTDVNILSDLNYKIKMFGPFEWEIGPVDDKLLYLAISPNLNEELLKTTAEIISYAPSCEGWWFLNAKPKKEYSPVLYMVNENGKGISIDISAWTYVLFHFDDDTFDIDLKISPIEGNMKTQKLAADIILTNLLGEERFITLIKNIQIVNEFGENENNATQISYINEHIDKVLS